MKYIWIVLDGEDNHDASPVVHSVFSTLEAAKVCADGIRNDLQSRHLNAYSQDGGTHLWKRTEVSSTGAEKWKSYITFDAQDHDSEHFPDGYCDGIVYIKKIELDVNNLRHRPPTL